MFSGAFELSFWGFRVCKISLIIHHPWAHPFPKKERKHAFPVGSSNKNLSVTKKSKIILSSFLSMIGLLIVMLIDELRIISLNKTCYSKESMNKNTNWHLLFYTWPVDLKVLILYFIYFHHNSGLEWNTELLPFLQKHSR